MCISACVTRNMRNDSHVASQDARGGKKNKNHLTNTKLSNRIHLTFFQAQPADVSDYQPVMD